MAKLWAHSSVGHSSLIIKRSRFARLGGNESLESLDLSWNNIRGRSAIEIANGLKVKIRHDRSQFGGRLLFRKTSV